MFKHVDIPYKNFYWLMFLYVTVNSRSSSCTDMRMCVHTYVRPCEWGRGK